MIYFLDTANIDEIKYWKEMGVADNVTTNPVLLAKEGKEPIEQILKIAKIVDGLVTAEVTLEKPEQMIKQARMFHSLGKNILVKLPAHPNGFLAAKELVKEKIRLNITLIFHPTQAIPFAKINADFLSLFIGRVEDWGLEHTHLIEEFAVMIQALKSKSKLLAASIRNPNYLMAAINSGADAITVPPSTWKNVYENPLMIQGEAGFMDGWNQLPKNLRKKYEDV